MEIGQFPAADEFSHNLTVDSVEETRALGRQISERLKGGEILLLNGPLGAGKTCLIQGMCEGLAVTEEVVSPTFTLVNTYPGRLKVHHLDFYRVEEGDDLTDIGVPDILDEVWGGEAVLLVEWPEPLAAELSPDQPRLELLAVPGTDPDQRTWYLRGVPEVPQSWQEMFQKNEDSNC